MAGTGCSSTSGSPRRRTPDRIAPLRALQAAGQPVVRIDVPGPYEIAAEFFRWEIATAVAGAILGINPFDQPDVEASKVATRKLTDEFEQTGQLPTETPILEADGIRLYADPRNAQELAAGGRTLAGVLRAHLARIRPGDYAAFLAYVEMTARHEAALQAMRTRVRDRHRVATCLGFGPRFLHSTGQAYKGGPNSGRVPPDHLRRRPGPSGARPALQLRRREGGPGPGRPRGSGDTGAARASRAPRRRTSRRACGRSARRSSRR